ncbi:DUF2946 family protein [Niveibacterium sp. 24ML]|uniref:DUF2946 family protein n=1 Tax=Niveibacterium sp. 24ML TaxID=2985512 RepID=UPI00226FFDC0|nr:DUF2946 family protein [Niveibacterium sp. 24ML]MCX9157009.1 DUF2946 family protein [Niveibacterium sp. 24ML]
MDAAVIRSLARWPDVPACHGWLSLDRQGRWRLQGEIVTHAGFAEFIGRNYLNDAAGRWFFQNGPQRVFVDLDYTPWVFRLSPALPSFVSHTGLPATEMAVWIDEAGLALLETDLGIGVLASQDLSRLAEAFTLDETLQRGSLSFGGRELPVAPIASGEVAGRFGFDPQPRP